MVFIYMGSFRLDLLFHGFDSLPRIHLFISISVFPSQQAGRTKKSVDAKHPLSQEVGRGSALILMVVLDMDMDLDLDFSIVSLHACARFTFIPGYIRSL